MYSLEFELPDGVQAEVNGTELFVRGNGKENQRKFKAKHVTISVEGNKVSVATTSTKKGDKAIVGTILGHIRNMAIGVNEGFEYKLKMVYAHFPMTIKVQGGKISVENFLGEKTARKINVVPNVDVKISGQDITITGFNKESVGLCASQVEQLCKTKKLDRRVFQDGIYIVEKNGKKLV